MSRPLKLLVQDWLPGTTGLLQAPGVPGDFLTMEALPLYGVH